MSTTYTAEDFATDYAAAAPRTLDITAFDAGRFTGEPPPIRWLVQDTIPLGVPALLAAMGDVGKSFKALQLCCRVVIEPRPLSGNLANLGKAIGFNFNVLGGEVVEHGSAVFVTAEDSDAAIHRRLHAIDPNEERRKYPGKLLVIPLPSAGGPLPFFVQDHNGVMITDEWKMVCDQLIKIKDLKLACFDPLANFAQVALDSDSAAAQFVTAAFGKLASETRATILLPHHMRKTSKAPANVAEAREAIRGSSAIVDGVRVAYALWPVDEDEGKKVCRSLQVPWQPSRVVKGAVVKTNEPTSRNIVTFVRDDSGILVDRTDNLQALRPAWGDLQDDLVESVARAAQAQLPFTKTGKGGLHQQRERLLLSLQIIGRDPLERLCQEMIDAGKIVQCRASGSNVPQWLDVAGGPFALGLGEFTHGAYIARLKAANGQAKNVTL